MSAEHAAAFEKLLADSTPISHEELAAFEAIKVALDEAFAEGGVQGVLRTAGEISATYLKK